MNLSTVSLYMITVSVRCLATFVVPALRWPMQMQAWRLRSQIGICNSLREIGKRRSPTTLFTACRSLVVSQLFYRTMSTFIAVSLEGPRKCRSCGLTEPINKLRDRIKSHCALKHRQEMSHIGKSWQSVSYQLHDSASSCKHVMRCNFVSFISQLIL